MLLIAQVKLVGELVKDTIRDHKIENRDLYYIYVRTHMSLHLCPSVALSFNLNDQSLMILPF